MVQGLLAELSLEVSLLAPDDAYIHNRQDRRQENHRPEGVCRDRDSQVEHSHEKVLRIAGDSKLPMHCERGC